MEKIKYNMESKLRPKWPYQSWAKVSFPSQQQAETGHTIMVPNKEDVTNGLQTFLSHFNNDLDISISETGKSVNKEINDLIENTMNDLQQKYELFRHCRLLKTGSVAEGTKVCEMNEFDFLLILDQFKRRDIFHVYFTDVREMQVLVEDCPDTETLVLQNPNLFARYPDNMRQNHPYFSDLHKNINGSAHHDNTKGNIQVRYSAVQTEGKTKPNIQTNENISIVRQDPNPCLFILKDMRNYCMDLFLTCFKRFLNESGSFIFDEKDSVCASDFAVTLHLRSERYKTAVGVDICFCIPITMQDIEKSIYCMRSNRFIYELMELNPDLEVFSVVGCKSPLLGSEVTTVRFTAPELELSFFKHFGTNSGQVKTYRYSKCLVNTFFPKVTVNYGCQRCYMYLIKSYHLKNIILYMMINHTDSDLWTGENIAVRVLEVFEILAKCSEFKSVSTYCTPGSVNISDFVTFTNLLVSLGRPVNRGTDYIYIRDSEIRYRLTYCPSYKNSLITRDEDIDQFVRKYFYYLNTDHWDSFELIDKVKSLLYDLYSIRKAAAIEQEEVLWLGRNNDSSASGGRYCPGCLLS